MAARKDGYIHQVSTFPDTIPTLSSQLNGLMFSSHFSLSPPAPTIMLRISRPMGTPAARPDPSFVPQKAEEKKIWAYRKQENIPKTAHIQVFWDGRVLLFDYEKKDPLTGNALTEEIRL